MNTLTEPVSQNIETRTHTRTFDERLDLSNRLAAAVDLSFIHLTSDEVAILAGLSVSKIVALCQSGQGPKPIRIGYRTIRFNAAEVVRWLQSM